MAFKMIDQKWKGQHSGVMLYERSGKDAVGGKYQVTVPPGKTQLATDDLGVARTEFERCSAILLQRQD
jgi:hypothetical protein